MLLTKIALWASTDAIDIQDFVKNNSILRCQKRKKINVMDKRGHAIEMTGIHHIELAS